MIPRPALSASSRALAPLLVLALLVGLGCPDRNVEPYRDEPVKTPDLSRIFPEGAERSADAEAPDQGPTMPPAPPGPAPGGTAGAAGAGSDAEPVAGVIRLAPELEGKVPPGAVLFLMARAGPGGPPTAVQRIPSPRFPMDFELGPGDRMIQSLPFAGPFRISARLDADGNAATRSPGDLQGRTGETYDPGDRGIELVIDELL